MGNESLELKRKHDRLSQGRFRRKLKEKCIKYKGGKCEICGYDKNFYALQFHHINSDEKEFAISNATKCTWEIIRKELDKCMLLCANCHHEIHSIEYDNKLKDLEKELKVRKVDGHIKCKNCGVIFYKDNMSRLCFDCRLIIAKRPGKPAAILPNKEILTELVNTKSLSKISEELGCGYSTLKKKCLELEIQIPDIKWNSSECTIRRKVIRPSKEEFESMLWEMPSSHIAKKYGVSDVTICKWAKIYGLEKPPKGYWTKVKAHNDIKAGTV